MILKEHEINHMDYGKAMRMWMNIFGKNYGSVVKSILTKFGSL